MLPNLLDSARKPTMIKKKKVIKAAEAEKAKDSLKDGKKKRSVSEIRNAMYGKKEGK
jgi:hypothetical protein